MRPLANDRDNSLQKKRSGKKFSWKEMLITTATYTLITTAAYYLMRKFNIPRAVMSLGAGVTLLVLITGLTLYKYKSLNLAQRVLYIGLIISLSVLTILMYMGIQVSVLHIAALLALPICLFKLLELRQKKTGSGTPSP